jgi:protease-4
MTNAIAESRKKPLNEIDGIIDNAPYDAAEAKEKGLIDDAFYRDQVYDELKNRLGYKADDQLRTVTGSQYREIPSDSLGLNMGERVAVIYASGAINIGHSSNSPFGGEMVGSDTIVKAFNDAAVDSSIKAIVLRVDSPGGSALASDLMWKAIEDAKAKKPVVVSMSDVAASGGYYISCNANKIVAEPSTITGSIGLFLGKPVLKGFYDWLGISNQYVTKGKNAGIFKETEHWTPDEKKKMYDGARHIYWDNFVTKVAKGRNKSNEEVDAIGEGRVWTGTQGKSNGLVDEFGGLEKAIDIAKQLANLPADKDVRRVVYPEPRPFFESYFGSDDSAEEKTQQAQAAIFSALPEGARNAFRYSQIFDRMSNGDAILMMPFELRIK